MLCLWRENPLPVLIPVCDCWSISSWNHGAASAVNPSPSFLTMCVHCTLCIAPGLSILFPIFPDTQNHRKTIHLKALIHPQRSKKPLESNHWGGLILFPAFFDRFGQVESFPEGGLPSLSQISLRTKHSETLFKAKPAAQIQKKLINGNNIAICFRHNWAIPWKHKRPSQFSEGERVTTSSQMTLYVTREQPLHWWRSVFL